MNFIFLIFFILCVLANASFDFQNRSLIKKIMSNQMDTGILQGKILLPEKAFKKIIRQRKSGRYSNRDIILSKKAKIYSEYEKTLIYLIPLNKENWRKKPKKAQLIQQNVNFEPALLAVQKGSSIAFINKDDLFHNVFSDSPIKKFSIGKQQMDIEIVEDFNQSGFIQVFCDIHAFMSATIAVLETPYFCIGNADSRFEIRDIPPGKYSLVGWHPQAEFKIQEIEIKENSTTIINEMGFH